MPYNLPNSGYVPPKLGLEDPRARPRQPPPFQQKATRRTKVVKGPLRLKYDAVRIGATIDFEYANTGPPSVSDLLYHLDLKLVNGDVPIAYTGNMHCIIDVRLCTFAHIQVTNLLGFQWPGMNIIEWDLQTPFRTRRSIAIEIANIFKCVIQDQAHDRVHGRQNLDVQKDGMHLFNVQLDRLYLEKVEYVREWDWWCARFSYEM